MVQPTELVEDGYLDPEANYTAFVEVIIPGSPAVGRSPYMTPRKPGEPIALEGTGVCAFNGDVVGV